MNENFEKGLTRRRAERAYSHRPVTRRLSAFARNARVLFREFRGILITFLAAQVLLTLSFHALWNGTPGLEDLTLSRAFFAIMGLFLFESSLEFPAAWHLQLYFFIVPLLGMIFFGLGIADFAVLLFNHRSRGEKWEEAVASTYHKHIIICGLGNVGIRVLRQMINLHEDVVCIELKEDNPRIVEARRYGVPVILGDSRSCETLEKAGARSATAIIVCTNDDLVNLQTASRIRELNRETRIVLRLFEEEFGKQFAAALNIDATLSASALAAPAFAGAATKTEIMNTFNAAGRILALGRIEVQQGSRLDGCEIGQLETSLEISVVMLENDDGIDTIPAGELLLKSGNILYVVAEMPAIQQLSHEWNQHRNRGDDG